jgi:hypothetical protein
MQQDLISYNFWTKKFGYDSGLFHQKSTSTRQTGLTVRNNLGTDLMQS